MTALYTLAEIRAIEQAAAAQMAPGTLMRRAGQAAAILALRLLSHSQGERRTLVLAGPGNNGGDALEVATCLSHAGEYVSILLFADPARLAVFFPSLLFGWMRSRTRGIGAGVAFHAMCNIFSETLMRGYGFHG